MKLSWSWCDFDGNTDLHAAAASAIVDSSGGELVNLDDHSKGWPNRSILIDAGI